MERFNRTVLDEAPRIALRTKFYESVEQLQADLDAWLVHYATERPRQGYRTMGRRPNIVIRPPVSSSSQKSIPIGLAGS